MSIHTTRFSHPAMLGVEMVTAEAPASKYPPWQTPSRHMDALGSAAPTRSFKNYIEEAGRTYVQKHRKKVRRLLSGKYIRKKYHTKRYECLEVTVTATRKGAYSDSTKHDYAHIFPNHAARTKMLEYTQMWHIAAQVGQCSGHPVHNHGNDISCKSAVNTDIACQCKTAALLVKATREGAGHITQVEGLLDEAPPVVAGWGQVTEDKNEERSQKLQEQEDLIKEHKEFGEKDLAVAQKAGDESDHNLQHAKREKDTFNEVISKTDGKKGVHS